MAMRVESLIESPKLGLKVKGDLSDLVITSDGDDDETCDKQKDSRAVSTLSNISQSLVRPSIQPVFGSVAVTNSENVQFGNNTYFHGPVTIVHGKTGVDNAAFADPDGNSTHRETFSQKETTDQSPIVKHPVLAWHKLALSAICITVIGVVIAIVLVLQSKTNNHSSIPQPQFDYSDPTSAAVVGYCYDNFQVIIITIILLLLTFLLISYSLLTRQVPGDSIRRASLKKSIHENCLVKSCTICYKEADSLIIAPDHLRIVSRTDWLAQPVEGELDKIRQPVPWVVITHTATASCFTQSQCVLSVRLIQTFHIESRGWDDIGYNFLVGGDGSVYYGRGWDYMGAHTKGYNVYSIGIAFIGTFNNDPPPKQQVEACQKIIRRGVLLGKLSKDYKLFAHRQLMSTLSPGDKVVEIIKEWPHYVKNHTDADALIPKYE